MATYFLIIFIFVSQVHGVLKEEKKKKKELRWDLSGSQSLHSVERWTLNPSVLGRSTSDPGQGLVLTQRSAAKKTGWTAEWQHTLSLHHYTGQDLWLTQQHRGALETKQNLQKGFIKKSPCLINIDPPLPPPKKKKSDKQTIINETKKKQSFANTSCFYLFPPPEIWKTMFVFLPFWQQPLCFPIPVNQPCFINLTEVSSELSRD